MSGTQNTNEGSNTDRMRQHAALRQGKQQDTLKHSDVELGIYQEENFDFRLSQCLNAKTEAGFTDRDRVAHTVVFGCPFCRRFGCSRS